MNLMGYHETPIRVYCPYLCREINVYIRSAKTEEVFIADFNGCDHHGSCSACNDSCRKKAQAIFTAEYSGTRTILWRIP